MPKSKISRLTEQFKAGELALLDYVNHCAIRARAAGQLEAADAFACLRTKIAGIDLTTAAQEHVLFAASHRLTLGGVDGALAGYSQPAFWPNAHEPQFMAFHTDLALPQEGPSVTEPCSRVFAVLEIGVVAVGVDLSAAASCDGCGKSRLDVVSCGRDDNGEPDSPDLCGVCRKEAEHGRFFNRTTGEYSASTDVYGKIDDGDEDLKATHRMDYADRKF